MFVPPLRLPAPAEPFSADAADAPASAEELALVRREQAFDVTVRARSEAEREANALRDIYQQQRKRDDEYLQKVIALI